MSDFEFAVLAFGDLETLTGFSVLMMLVTYFLTRRNVGGFLWDPFHFYYTFTFGTAYGVVLFLLWHGKLTVLSLYVVLGLGITFLIAFSIASNRSYLAFNKIFYSLLPPQEDEVNVINLAKKIYIIMAVAFVAYAGFGFLAESRFEAAKGLGPISRYMDVLWLLIIAFFSLRIARARESGKRNWILSLVPLLAFILFGSLLNGAKVGVLLGIQAGLYAVAVSNIRIHMSRFKIIIGLIFITIVSFTFATTVLKYNLVAADADLTVRGQHLEKIGIVPERFINRVIANGDVYYLALPNELIDRIEIDSIFVRFLAPVVSSTLMSYLLSYTVSDYDVGRLIWLYWYPGDTVSRGPTNHFDLTAYVYFGPVVGVFFVIGLGIFLGQVNRLRMLGSSTSDFGCAVLSTIWCQSLLVLLHPAIGFARILDVLLVCLVLKACIKKQTYS